jgi:hypothetical protein
LDSGKGLYIEGTDFGYSNNGTALYYRFGCTYLGDGNPMATGNVQNVAGQTGTFADGLTYDYLYQQVPDNYVDWIGSNNGTIYFTSQDSEGRAVNYSGPSGAYRAIHSAVILGAMSNGTTKSTKNELMDMYVDYLTELIGVEERERTVVSNLTVYPNPAFGSVSLSFNLSHAGHVTASIYNVAGQRLHQLMDDNLAAGNHHLIWRGDNSSGNTLSSGTYILRIETEKETLNKAVVFID